MRRLALAITLLLILGACSDAGDTTVDPTDTSTTVASATDEAPSSTTSTSEPPPPASQAPVPSGPIEFETFPGTPPNEFETFAADMVMTMTIDDVAIEVSSVGVWTDTAFECTVSSELGGIAFSESVIATPEELWLDNGRGYEPSDLFGSSAQDILSSCPASPLFWASFNAEDFGAISGDEEMIDGRSAVKADLAGVLKELGGLGILGGFEGADVSEMTMWLDSETGAILAMMADMTMSEQLMEEFGGAGTGPISIVMDFTVTQVNDASLLVELPTDS